MISVKPGRTGNGKSFAEIGLAPVLKLPEDCDARAFLLALTDHPRTTRLDLIEWIRPRSERPHGGTWRGSASVDFASG